MQSWPAPAKLNLFLQITGRRPDGYHTLQTVFQFLDYGDDLEFSVTNNGRIALLTPLSGVPENNNLAIRAAELLKKATGIRQGTEIQIKKRLPLGGGLGGGSSDAATTLLALNVLWGANLSVTELAALGLELGADVPVFVHGHAAWAEGIGEILTPLEPEEAWYLVVVPPVHVSTAKVFSNSELTRYSRTITIRDFQEGRGRRNDLEPIVRRSYPEVNRAMSLLEEFGEPRLSGSGGCVFLKLDEAGQGQRILKIIPKQFTGFVARGMNRHPLYRMSHGMQPGLAGN